MGFFGDLAGAFHSAAEGVGELRKASIMGDDSNTARGRGPGVAMVTDPLVWSIAGIAYKEKPFPASYSVLRYLCKRDTVLAAIILTRLRQVKTFARVRTHEEVERTNTTGFRVRLKVGAGNGRTPQVERTEDDLTQFIARCGRADVTRRERSFAHFLWKFVKDRLEIDQATAEKRKARDGTLVEFYAIDGASIRIVDPAKRNTDAAYVQLWQNRPVAKFLEEDLMFCPENITTDIYANGYSVCETEIAIKKIMAHLGIDETNSRQFHPGSMPKGFLQVVNADISEDQIQVLEARWRNQVANYRGKHKLPFIPIPRGGKMEFVALPQATDIEHGNFLDYLVNTLTSLYGMDPAEINFPNRSGGIAGATPSLIQSSPEATRLTASRDKGLRTLLAYLEDCINDEIMPDLDPTGDFEFSFVGFDRQTDVERADLENKTVRFYKTVNEIREAHGLEPRDDGDVILDATWLQAKQGAEMSQMQEQMGGGEGGPPEEGGQAPAPGGEEEEGWGAPEEEEGDLF